MAELMLQQTSVERVVDVYPEFVDRYHSPSAVIDIAESDLAEEIHPLGLRKRAEYFARVCERIVEEHDGRVPSDLSDLLEVTRRREVHGSFRARARSRGRHAGRGYERRAGSLPGFRIGDPW